LPVPATRVKLELRDDSGENIYINANWIKGYDSTKYIATQAPLKNTFGDFWQIVYECDVNIIVMLTRWNEDGKIKADKYWMDKGISMTFRELIITLNKETMLNEEITLRDFTVMHAPSNTTRSVFHIHYTGWPDFGKPDCTKTFKEMLFIIDRFNTTEGRGPILSHCSAGLGRTGTLISAHIYLEMIRSENIKNYEEVEIKSIVQRLREQRRGMVQSLDQYTFLHEVVEELAVGAGKRIKEDLCKMEEDNLEVCDRSKVDIYQLNVNRKHTNQLSRSLPVIKSSSRGTKRSAKESKKTSKREKCLTRSCSASEKKRREFLELLVNRGVAQTYGGL